jgi:hypothetical protein
MREYYKRKKMGRKSKTACLFSYKKQPNFTAGSVAHSVEFNFSMDFYISLLLNPK